jgi:hypothetical protein
MRVELPSGAWVECRDELTGGDKRRTQEAITFTIQDGQQQRVSAGIHNDMRVALLAGIITAWSYAEDKGWPIPASNPGGSAVLDLLPIDDYNALGEAMEPLLKKVSFGGDKVPN